MVWISRPAVVIDFEAIAAQFNHALGLVVALLAQRLQLAEYEFIPIVVVLLDVVRDRRQRHEAMCKAHPAQRLGSQLQRASTLPPSGAVRMLLMLVHLWRAQQNIEDGDQRDHAQRRQQPVHDVVWQHLISYCTTIHAMNAQTATTVMMTASAFNPSRVLKYIPSSD